MNVTFAYAGQSELVQTTGRAQLTFAPNLSRDPVAFDAGLAHPLRFREAMSALHDVVISDLRYQPRDKTAYLEWKKAEQDRERVIRQQAYQEARDAILARRDQPVPADLEKNYNACRRRYWKVRQQYSNYLLRHDQALWRQLMPCDPVVTVSDDVVFFECFSADESSYGCLTVGRDEGFTGSVDMQPGTTNVDYSWDLYHHFQALRSYRETRLKVDPSGFEVATDDNPSYREEKIDLPDGWLRGFMQLQGAMGLPMRRVSLSRECVYSILAWLKRRKAKTSPRAIRFDLLPDKPPALVLEPWDKEIVSHGTTYHGPPGEAIRIWGRRRLLVLARLLPLVDHVDVYLLGTGMPSFWVAQMGEMRLTLGLSGWTTNDWTRGSAVDLLAPPADPSEELIHQLAQAVRSGGAKSLDDAARESAASPAECVAALKHLAHTGQVIYDLAGGVYRWRQVMPRALGEAEIGSENPELAESRKLASQKFITVSDRREAGSGTLFSGKVESYPVEMLLDGDGLIKRGKCYCSHYRRYGFKNGPCRHMLALRQFHLAGNPAEASRPDPQGWYQRLVDWSNTDNN